MLSSSTFAGVRVRARVAKRAVRPLPPRSREMPECAAHAELLSLTLALTCKQAAVRATGATARQAAWSPGSDAPSHLAGELPGDFGTYPVARFSGGRGSARGRPLGVGRLLRRRAAPPRAL